MMRIETEKLGSRPVISFAISTAGPRWPMLGNEMNTSSVFFITNLQLPVLFESVVDVVRLITFGDKLTSLLRWLHPFLFIYLLKPKNIKNFFLYPQVLKFFMISSCMVGLIIDNRGLFQSFLDTGGSQINMILIWIRIKVGSSLICCKSNTFN